MLVDARVSFLFPSGFVLTSPGHAAPLLTLPADDTRGGEGRGDEEELLSLLSCLSITLRKREKEREQNPDQDNNLKKGHTGLYIKEKTLLFSILLFKEGIFLPFPPLSFSTPIFSSEIPVLSIRAPELLWDFR